MIPVKNIFQHLAAKECVRIKGLLRWDLDIVQLSAYIICNLHRQF